MLDPVIAPDGFTYERSAIEDWLLRCQRSPMTNLDLLSGVALVPNVALRGQIADWRSRRENDNKIIEL
jgi:hypothetical protein